MTSKSNAFRDHVARRDSAIGVVAIAVVGTRGVPARYGGFETLVEQLALQIDPEKIQLTVYGEKSAYSEPERKGDFAGHRRVWMPFSASGAQSILHDGLQLFHAVFVKRHRRVLMLGTSAAWLLPLVWLFRPGLRIVTNVDGLEWRRDKFGNFARWVLKFLEKIAVRFSETIVADNEALIPIVRELHGVEPSLIAYGADHVLSVAPYLPSDESYFLAIARVEPENNTAMIIEAAAKTGLPLKYVGNWGASEYGKKLLMRYSNLPNIDLISPVYDQLQLSKIRAGCAAYIHGHSVGGTNPSLLEAIYHADRILAFDCEFNRATLEAEGAYFTNGEKLCMMMLDPVSGSVSGEASERLRSRYRWSAVAQQYLDLLTDGTTPKDAIRNKA
jgi:glycosyltransferase involved in cell wall biosynthesis